MRVLVVIMMFCAYEAFVQAHHCGKPTETETRYTLKEAKSFETFVEKVFGSTSAEVAKQNLTELTIRYDGEYYYLKYILGDHEVANKFRPNEPFDEKTWFGTISTTVNVIEVRHLQFLSTLSNGKQFTRNYDFDTTKLKMTGNSTSDVDCTFEIILERTKHE
ncbi:hypothetical protein HCN44_004955 [Aphidius gifuensis]|uniref:Odorant-binding protein n=1 Tax=Aphidius gifuensis TaxID=684658 RepID=A0A834XXH4_APHGI|nr:uncharacterized protein LOC122852614 [Aphidius gifuensis]KAF7992611.1 hypothetical protein HCN44_004955 [Aphidius gifuensis]